MARILPVLAVVLSVAVLLVSLVLHLQRPLIFDDAYMFYRYAMHVREGMGISWNTDGVHTYGLTSHGWLAVVLPFTWLPLPPGPTLQLASWLTGVAGLALMGLGVLRRGTSNWAPAIAAAGTAVLVLVPQFAFHLTTGMDTMLAFAVNAMLVLLFLNYRKHPSLRRAVGLGLAAFLAFIVRPDSGLCAMGVPLLGWALHGGRRRYADLTGLLMVPGLLIAAFIGWCYLYYGVPLPLGFYAKSAHSYAGFQSRENPIDYMIDFLVCVLPFLVVLCATGSRCRLLIACLVPVVLTMLYLLTVRQVMGSFGRYYIPLLPYVVIPALLALDERLRQPRPLSRSRAGLGALLAIGGMAVLLARQPLVDAYLDVSLPEPVAVPELPAPPLPARDWWSTITRFGEDVAGRLPAGTVIAASEVGYLGVAAPHVQIVDLVGLNDTEIGRNGLDVQRLVERAPDLIWLPHTDYTGLRASLLSSPEFLRNYEVIAGAYSYGLAVRRESPMRSRIESVLQQAWPQLYPGTHMKDYVVTAGS